MRGVCFLVSLLAGGCLPEVGECDPVAAERVAFNTVNGAPAFEGQALVIASCASRGFCHAAPVEGDLEDQNGVPGGLMFDVQLAATDASANEDAVIRQRRARFRLVQEARNILDVVDRNTMPPPPPAGDDFFDGAPLYADSEGDLLPPVGGPAGYEILRNWLACGAPVVERSVPHPDGVPAVVRAGRPLEPLEPTWESIFTNLLALRCAGSLCHGGASDAGFRIDVDDAAATYDALAEEASGEDCADMGLALLVPGDASASLLYEKLRGRPSCGETMPSGDLPVSPADLAAIEQWIADGAPP